MPPACTSITGGAVARVAAVEVDSKGATGATVDGCRVSEAGVDIDSDKVPARVEGSLGQYWMKNMRSLLTRIESYSWEVEGAGVEGRTGATGSRIMLSCGLAGRESQSSATEGKGLHAKGGVRCREAEKSKGAG